MGLASGLFPPGFPSKTLHAPLFYSLIATCPAHFILLDLITRIILGEKYRLSSSLCSLLQSLATLSLLGLFSKPILRHPQPTFLPQREWPSFTPIQNSRQNYSSVYLNLCIFGYQDYAVISFPWEQWLHEHTSMLCYLVLLNITNVLSHRKHMKYSSKNS